MTPAEMQTLTCQPVRSSALHTQTGVERQGEEETLQFCHDPLT